ncbi:hypothetical protein L2E82_34333 [Cichorium intybus]|uniref:Uncharacterized protein n=1 Tax=Cichorium intybus TaxID=13427 RepID=A0ACB9BLY7_CICIN|nr:hypothetical protein L2E82_34333 [Cichorium intybus]
MTRYIMWNLKDMMLEVQICISLICLLDRRQNKNTFSGIFREMKIIISLISSSYQAEAPRPSGSLVLAGLRTKRPDILRKYVGGWDITNKLYCASVGFTGCATLILAIIWFVLFGVAMITHHFCGWRIDIKGKNSIFLKCYG